MNWNSDTMTKFKATEYFNSLSHNSSEYNHFTHLPGPLDI